MRLSCLLRGHDYCPVTYPVGALDLTLDCCRRCHKRTGEGFLSRRSVQAS